MPMERGVEKAPGNADRGERLQHFEVARCRSARQSQPLEVNEQRYATGDGGEQKEQDDGGAGVRLHRHWP